MKNLLKLGAILFALVTVSCQDNGSEPDNPSPSLYTPVLKTPASGATDISLTPTFVWETSGEDAVYDLSVSDDNGETWNIVADELPVTTYKLQENQQLDYETTYDWKVTASLDGESKTSLVFSFTTVAEGEEPALSAPVLTTPASGAIDISLTPTFEWETSGDGVIYDLSLSSDNGVTWTVMAEDLNVVTYTFTQQQALDYAITYKWKVIAKSGDETEESTVFSFTTENKPLVAPALTAPASDATDISLTPTFVWETSGEDAVYDLSISDDNGETWDIVAEELSVTTYTLQEDQQLDYEKTYDWKVTAKFGDKTEESTIFSFTTENEELSLSAPVLTAPASGVVDISLTPDFIWETSGEGVAYDLSLSSDNGITWTVKAEGLTAISYTLTEQQKLSYATTYKWKVTAKLGEETEESTVFSFTTVAANPDKPGPPYTDGQSYLYLDSQKSNPFTIVVTGDGFTQEDYDSGFFDEKTDALMDMFFNVEPYKAYKEYFRVYKLVAISNDRGISVEGYRSEDPPARPALQQHESDTKFGIEISAGSGSSIYIPRGTEPGRESAVRRIYDIVKPSIPGMMNPSMAENTVILMLANINAYGGSAHSIDTNGQSIAIAAMPASGVAGENSYINIMLHETGHAIGKLGDEYHPASGGMSSYIKDMILTIRDGDPWFFCANIDLNNDRTKAIWAKYYGMQGYENVGYFEGAGGTTGATGAWRSTQESLMKSDLASLWFNTVSREAIVRRILSVAGEQFDWEEFLRKDVNTPTVQTTSSSQTSYPPLIRPMIWD